MMVLNELEKDIAVYLERHCLGKDRALLSRELEFKFSTTHTTIKLTVNHLRSEGVPICSSANGYYYAETEEDVLSTIRQLRGRIEKISCAERGLTKTLIAVIDSGKMLSPLATEEWR